MVDDDHEVLSVYSRVLTAQGYRVYTASTVSDAKRLLADFPVDLLVTDLRIDDDHDENDLSGLELAIAFEPSLPVIIFTGHPSVGDALQNLSQEPTYPTFVPDIVPKDLGAVALLSAVEAALHRSCHGIAQPLQVEGALTDVEAAAYITRSSEREITQRLRRMEYVLVIEPSKQGKTSLVSFLIRNPPTAGTLFVYMDVSSLRQSGEEDWYGGLYGRIYARLDLLSLKLASSSRPSSAAKWREFFSSLGFLLQAQDLFLVIALDEIGGVPITSAFFTVLRDIYNSRQAEPHFKRITFIFLGTFFPEDVGGDGDKVPFNVAHRIRLPDFTLTETTIRVRRLVESDVEAALLAARIFYWVEGQPYLTQKLCESLHAGAKVDDIGQAVERFKRNDAIHFPPLVKRLRNDLDAIDFIYKIRSGERIRFFPSGSLVQRNLDLIGIINSDGMGYCKIRNRLYGELLETLWSDKISKHPSGNGGIGAGVNSLSKLGRRAASKYRVLFLAAEPSDKAHLRLGKELRDIEVRIQKAKARRRVIVIAKHSVRLLDISQAIYDESPQIIHFSGHGEGTGDLYIEDDFGRARLLAPEMLGELLSLTAKSLACVVLNACFSAIHASAIAKHVKYVIGMKAVIKDEAAIVFSSAFYQALERGSAIRDAFRIARIHSEVGKLPQDMPPVLFVDGEESP